MSRKILSAPDGFYVITSKNGAHSYVIRMVNGKSEECADLRDGSTHYSTHSSFWEDWGIVTTASDEQIVWLLSCIKHNGRMSKPFSNSLYEIF